MKKLLAIAAFLLASTAAQAQYTFEYSGRTIRIDPDRGTVSIPGVYDNTGRRSKRAREQDSDKSLKQPAPQDAKADPQTPVPAPAPTNQAASPPPPAAANPPPPEPATSTANNAPADNAVLPPPPSVPAPPPQQDAAPVPKPAPPPTVAAVPPPPQPAAPALAPVAHDPNSPLGVWLTEEKEGKVRIEQCGANLCGYSVDAKSNKNGEQVLINMRPSKDQKWSGRILDPNSGSTYDSTIAMKGTDTLRVQGCAFGGMFCGGQTWTRLN